MKKFLGFLLVGALLTTTALAEDIDLTSLSLAELTSLEQRVSAEISSRVPDSANLLPEGLYSVGEDLSAGKYLFMVTYVRTYSNGDTRGAVRLEDSNGKSVLWAKGVEPGEVMYFSLQDGMTVKLSNCSGMLSIADQSWAK